MDRNLFWKSQAVDGEALKRVEYPQFHESDIVGRHGEAVVDL